MYNCIRFFKAIVVVLVFYLPSYSMQIGLTGGLSRFKMSIDPMEFDYKNGLVMGALAEIDLNKYLSVEIIGVYSMRGTIFNISHDPSATYYLKRKIVTLNYLALPCQLKLKCPVNNVVIPFLFTGINVGFMLNGRIDWEEINNNKPYISQTEDWSTNSWADIGIEIGLGIDFKIKKYTPFIKFNEHFGLKNLGEPKQINNGIEIQGGLKVNVALYNVLILTGVSDA